MSDVDAVTPELLDEPGVIVTKWVVVAEVIMPDGTRDVIRNWSDTCEMWDVDGLLTWAAGDWDED